MTHAEDTQTAYSRWTERQLMRAVCRTTPARERWQWVATACDRQWTRTPDGVWEAREGGNRDEFGRARVTVTCDDDTLRAHLVEQLEHYGVTDAAISWMLS